MVDCGRSEALLRRGRISVLCALLLVGGLSLLRHDLLRAPLPSRVAPVTSASLMARLPMVFEPNMGQASDAGFYVALARGYFAAEGLDVQPVAVGSGGRMVPSLGAGQIEVGGGGLSTALINAVARDVPLRLIADKGSLRPGFGYSGLVVRKGLDAFAGG